MLSDFIYRTFITLRPIFRAVTEDKDKDKDEDIPLRKWGLVCQLLIQLRL